MVYILARKKKDKSVEEKNKEIYDNLLEFLIQGNRKSLNTKNKKLLKDFENEVETYQKRIYFLYQIQDSYLEWNTLSTDVNANFNQLIYLINLNKEDLHRQYISPYDIDPKYLKTDKSKIIINKDEKIMKDYIELEKKVGII
ncbi:hypothetical protein FNU3_78 [Fusobacterium phage vB_FnuS_FNU3]|uniref:Polysaccharide biosynthesis protein n=1 Tax=Fusobacterium phage Fnu1 TaxID=2530024 RepID=A0A481W7D8_9CAUD|nr:polysaccharide biosynthesis protein [Fusobacterium phage Fnu1]QBJ04152.1 polysaccharide biosynthesis protein [Fusobacterium phage Fnu1]WGH50271.1 putative polysaccharide biosynthesis protein [Fusobacterium phage vB_FnuS_FNU2]WGH50412.1 hypothetical protein FNU3_78 [Fusobacterium phage vB_FnuS_FNU3]